MALQMMRRTTSQTPIGRTPGHLSSAINRQATKAFRPLGSTRVVEMRLAKEASASHRSEEADLKDEHRNFHALQSRPEGPAAPSILRIVL